LSILSYISINVSLYVYILILYKFGGYIHLENGAKLKFIRYGSSNDDVHG